MTENPRRDMLMMIISESQAEGKDVTVSEAIWLRLGRFWQELVGIGYMPTFRSRIDPHFKAMMRDGWPLRDIQQSLWERFHCKIRIKTLIRWIMQSKGRKVFVWG